MENISASHGAARLRLGGSRVMEPHLAALVDAPKVQWTNTWVEHSFGTVRSTQYMVGSGTMREV